MEHSVLETIKVKGKKLYLVWDSQYMNVHDSSRILRLVTTCLVRGSPNGEPFAGAAIQNYGDAVDERLAMRLSLRRAVTAYAHAHIQNRQTPRHPTLERNLWKIGAEDAMVRIICHAYRQMVWLRDQAAKDVSPSGEGTPTTKETDNG